MDGQDQKRKEVNVYGSVLWEKVVWPFIVYKRIESKDYKFSVTIQCKREGSIDPKAVMFPFTLTLDKLLHNPKKEGLQN